MCEEETVMSDILTQCKHQCGRIKIFSLIYCHTVTNSCWGYKSFSDVLTQCKNDA